MGFKPNQNLTLELTALGGVQRFLLYYKHIRLNYERWMVAKNAILFPEENNVGETEKMGNHFLKKTGVRGKR